MKVSKQHFCSSLYNTKLQWPSYPADILYIYILNDGMESLCSKKKVFNISVQCSSWGPSCLGPKAIAYLCLIVSRSLVRTSFCMSKDKMSKILTVAERYSNKNLHQTTVSNMDTKKKPKHQKDLLTLKHGSCGIMIWVCCFVFIERNWNFCWVGREYEVICDLKSSDVC